jgi:hypothetical protein
MWDQVTTPPLAMPTDFAGGDIYIIQGVSWVVGRIMLDHCDVCAKTSIYGCDV